MNFNWTSLKPIHSICIMIVFAGLFGCAPSAPDIVEDWQGKGWEIVRVHGNQGEIERHGKLISDQAKAIEASWVVNGERKTKLYSQSNHKILLLRFFKKDGDQFAVVMKKRK